MKIIKERILSLYRDDTCVFTLSREEILSRGSVSIAVTPDFATARKGDDGFWVFSSGECGDDEALRAAASLVDQTIPEKREFRNLRELGRGFDGG